MNSAATAAGGAGGRSTSTRTMPGAARRARRRGQRLPRARTRGTYGVAVETHQRSQAGPAVRRRAPATRTTARCRRGCGSPPTCSAPNLGTRVITIHWGGFDTHSGQLASQDAQLTELSRALGAFRADLRRAGSRTAWRRWCSPSSAGASPRTAPAGTDHGAGGLMLAMGSGVRGGLASEWPGCRPQDLVPVNNAAQGNLKVPTDYRSVYRAVIEEWLGDDPDAMIGGGAIDPLVRGDGATGPALFKAPV